MAIGIYKLVWNNSDKIYVGQSVNIENRYINHMSKFRNNQHSAYMQNMYNKYDSPQLVILEECSISELDHKEIYWISVSDTVNISVGGSNGLFGVNSPRCRYTKEQIVLVAQLLTNPNYTDFEISELTGVSCGTIMGIRKRKRHNWLAEEFPDLWKSLEDISRFSTAQARRFKTDCTLCDVDGKYHIVTNISKFAKENNLNKGHLCALVRGEILSHKGYTLVENRKELNE